MKMGMRSWFMLVSSLAIIGLSLFTGGWVAQAVDVIQGEDSYSATGPEPDGFDAPVPEDAENTSINISDAFTLPGIYNAESQYFRNNAYMSQDRSNVLILYDGSAQNQKSSIWYNQQLNLNYPFEFEAYVYLSDVNKLDNGIGDGITFTLQRDPKLQNAIGGTGGGIGVFPNQRVSLTMIYNALSIELDTFFNDGIPNYDLELIQEPFNLSRSLAWPHIGMSTTATSGNLGNVSGYKPIEFVYDHFTHRGLTSVSSATEQQNWFNKWVKLNVKWTPNGTPGDYNNIKTGDLSYTWGPIYDSTATSVQHQYATKTWPDINIDGTFGSEYSSSTGWTPENRYVTWGFTGSNYYAGNPFGVMITKLPNEPSVTVDRTVRNTSVTSEVASSSTQANPGDVLEYKVRVANTSTDGVTIPLRNTEIVEDLQDNSWNQKFTYTSNLTSATAPTPEVTGTNFTFTDTKNSIEPGQWFEYTYQVIVGADTTEFINDVEVSSTYSTLDNFGETNVTVYPDGLNLEKTVNDSNPKVGDTVDITLDLTATTGISVLKTITDSIPVGFELVADSTLLTVYEGTDKTQIKGTEQLSADIWSGTSTSGYNFTFNADDDLTDYTLKELLGGQINNNLLELTYKIKPTEAIKGERNLPLGVASTNLTNKFNGQRGTLDYTVTAADLDLTVKTDLTFNFLDENGQPIAANVIESLQPDFSGTNPVVLYFNSDETYNYTTTIAEITANLLADHNLSLFRADVNGVSGSLTDMRGTVLKEGTVVDLYYGSKAVLVIEFVDESGLPLDGHTITVGEAVTNTIQTDLYVGDTVDLTSPMYQLVQDKVADLLKAGYSEVIPPTNEGGVVINSIRETVKYQVNGQLAIMTCPENIDFGNLEYNGYVQRVDAPTISDQLTVVDTRSDRSANWVLKLSLLEQMENKDTGAVLGNALRYVTAPDNEIILDSTETEIYRNTSGNAGIFNITETWGTTEGSNGLKLVFDPSTTTKSVVGSYSAKILWTLEEAP